MMRWCLAILLLVLYLPSASAQDLSGLPVNHDRSAGPSRGLDEYFSTTDETYPERDFNPDKNEQQRLVVEWGKVSMVYVDRKDSVTRGDQVWTNWKDDSSLRKDRRLSIRGRLLIESVYSKSRQPIDWVQGVRVVVSRLPEKKHDWSSRQEMRDAVWDNFVIGERGEFLAIISPGEVRGAVGKELPFQVGLSLGKKDRKQITWTNTFTVLPQSVKMLKIPGPQAISETMQIINGAPSYRPRDFNPAKLVRAVNHLLTMGKAKALSELREFLKIAQPFSTLRGSYESVRVDENIDTADRNCIFLIVRLLFESADLPKKLPNSPMFLFFPDQNDQDRKDWPLYPLYLQDDVPFLLSHPLIRIPLDGSLADQPEWYIEWAEAYGKIRNQPLRPLDDPMLAAEHLIAHLETRRLNQFAKFDDLFYKQAWNILEDVNLAMISDSQPHFEFPDWGARVKAAAKFKIRWSETDQKYIRK